ncbi:hypothetical protein JCM15519_11830 [Fundidesulfovibrio butyratiphilus]
MIAFSTALLLLGLYALGMLALAQYVESRPNLREAISGSSVIYTLSLATYLSAWTYYGITGQASEQGLQFMPSYLAPVLAGLTMPWVLTRLVRLKQAVHITSIADYLGARYGKSHLVGGLASTLALFGLLPYVALQLRAIIASFSLLTQPQEHSLYAAQSQWIGPILLAFMVFFTIVAGVRRLDPTERHQGMVAVVALESLVKMTAFLSVGVFVCWGLFDGPGDIFAKAEQASLGHLMSLGSDAANYGGWMSRLVLFLPVLYLLPRQFHVAVVENSSPRHVRTAMWLFPLYMLAVTLPVLPIALSGRLLGYDPRQADTLVLVLPQHFGNTWLSFLVFLGGFSSGMSMVAINAMAMTTMVTNDLILPLAGRVASLSWLRRFLLPLRWAVLATYLTGGYLVHILIGESSMLDSMGIVSLVAVGQFAPAAILGLFWRRGNRAGALAGLGLGFAIWLYTLALPTLGKGSHLFAAFTGDGPLGLPLLAPQALFGLTALDPVTHTMFWSFLFNTGAYVVFSLATSPRREEAAFTSELFALMEVRVAATPRDVLPRDIILEERLDRLERLFTLFMPLLAARHHVREAQERAGLSELEWVSVVDLAAMYAEAERILAGMIGAASAHKAIHEAGLYSLGERAALFEIYGRMLADLNLSPEELRHRVDYYKEREVLLMQHANQLTSANKALEEEVCMRRRAEEEARMAEQSFRSIFENALEGIFQTLPDGRVTKANPALAKILGYDDPEDLMACVKDVDKQVYARPGEREKLLEMLRDEGSLPHYETRMLRKSGEVIWVALHATGIRDKKGNVAFIEGILEDITERKANEQLLRQASQTVRNIIDSMPSVMAGVDPSGKITHWNRQAVLRYGIEADQAEGRALLDLLPWLEPVWDLAQRAFATSEPQRLAHLPETLHDKNHLLDVLAYPVTRGESDTVVLRLDDVTERVRVEEMMVESEKMFSLGGLAAGMAHEINNPLGAIIASAQNIKRRMEPQRQANKDTAESCGLSLEALARYLQKRGILEMADNIEESGRRAARIVHNMLDFSRKSDVTFEQVSIPNLLEKSLELASQDYDLKKKFDFRKIRIERRFAPDLPPIPCRAAEIEQVLLNLLRNAAQAMSTMRQEGREPVITLSAVREDNMARIEVCDNGPGMDEATRKRVFEPFFTTKPVGLGTGLGLSVSYFIVTTRHGGFLSVESKPGHGARFILRLPLSPPGASETPTDGKAQS